MPLLPRTLLALGSILLIHACYSAHEYSSLASSPTSSSSSPTISEIPPSQSPPSLPHDITLETLAAVLLLCIALVLGAEELKPIRWRVWAGCVQHGPQRAGALADGGNGADGRKGKKGVESGAGSEGFEWLEGGKRRGFLDIRGLRRGFAGWMREEGGR